MANGYTPAAEVYGANAALINSRLVDVEYVDAAGIESDSLKLTVNIEGLDGLPSMDGRIGLRIGYRETGLVDRGEFIVSRATPQLFPALLLVVATAAPFKVRDETRFKERRSRSYAAMTLGGLFRYIAAEHGFTPRVAPDLDGIPVLHEDQSNETDAAFLTRLARRHDAVAKPVNELYVLARRGQVKTLSGKELPPVKLAVTKDNRPGDRAFIGASVDHDGRVRFKGCRTTWWDGAAGVECQVEVGAEPFKRIRQRYESEAQARQVAEGELRRVERSAAKLRIDCPGNPAFGAEGLLELDESWPSYMRGTWSIDKVTGRLNRREGYRCTLEASYPEGRTE